MDGDVVCRHSFALSQQEQQFLAFVAHGDDVCLSYMLQIVQGKGEVEHGGEFYQYVSCLAQQQFFEGGYIGFAVADGYGLSAVSVAAGRSMNIQSTGSISCRWQTLSAWQTEMWFRPRTGKLCAAIWQRVSWRST